LDFLGKLKSVGIEAQHSIEEWHMFSHHLLQTTPTIYQTTFEGLATTRTVRGYIDLPKELPVFQSHNI
jgi:hypothetical protein